MIRADMTRATTERPRRIQGGMMSEGLSAIDGNKGR